jgi:hypothetical protein
LSILFVAVFFVFGFTGFSEFPNLNNQIILFFQKPGNQFNRCRTIGIGNVERFVGQCCGIFSSSGSRCYVVYGFVTQLLILSWVKIFTLYFLQSINESNVTSLRLQLYFSLFENLKIGGGRNDNLSKLDI